MEIRDIPEYQGAGIYALIDANGCMYVGSSKNCRNRILQHRGSQGINYRMREYVETGGAFTASILEELPNANEKELEAAERAQIKKAGNRATYNIAQASRGAMPSTHKNTLSTRSITDFARGKGVSPQAVYKRLSRLKIPPESLREPETGRLSENGIAILEDVMRDIGQSQRSREDVPLSHKPSTATVDINSAVVDQLQKQVDSLQQQLTEEKHRAELAELKAEAVADERDFLRRQLDNAIKANALASVKRLTAPDPEEPAEAPAEEAEAVPVEDQPQQPERQRIGARIRAAWQIIRGK